MRVSHAAGLLPISGASNWSLPGLLRTQNYSVELPISTVPAGLVRRWSTRRRSPTVNTIPLHV